MRKIHIARQGNTIKKIGFEWCWLRCSLLAKPHRGLATSRRRTNLVNTSATYSYNCDQLHATYFAKFPYAHRTLSTQLAPTSPQHALASHLSPTRTHTHTLPSIWPSIARQRQMAFHRQQSANHLNRPRAPRPNPNPTLQ